MYNPYAQFPQYNPQSNNFQNSYNANYQQLQRQEIIKVNGENGAKAYQLAPNSSVILLDEQSPIIWLKVTDGAGFPSITPYTITPYQAEPSVDVKSLEERIKKLEERLNESNIASTKHSEAKLHE